MNELAKLFEARTPDELQYAIDCRVYELVKLQHEGTTILKHIIANCEAYSRADEIVRI